MLQHCRIAYPLGEQDEIVNGIAERSEGWPQHVHTETAALFGGLLRANGILAGVDRDAVKKRHGPIEK